MKKRVQSGIVISVIAVLALFLAGCDKLPRVLAPTPTLTPGPPYLTPARDFTGIWVSSLPGVGIEYTTALTGQPYGWTGDVELTLKQEGNEITGFVRVFNLERKVIRPDILRQEEERSKKLKEP